MFCQSYSKRGSAQLSTVLLQDTITAIATPFGTAGVGIIRISGPQALEIAHRVFRPAHANCPWETHHLYHGDIISADGKTILDEALVSFMKRPHSFTGEDVLEINCHGNPLIMKAILKELVALGCRLAGPGEFSQRAFFNNRIDLSQAEALASMIAAKSAKACAIGLAQLKGSLTKEIENLRTLLIDALAMIEVTIDFTDDVAAGDIPQLPRQIDLAATRLQSLLASYREAKIYTEGINVVITGKPNVGKSSLLNTLTGKKKAIVTDIPGTTRDLITDMINIKGVPVNLVDTAGIREPKDAIEKEGIQLVWENLASADVVIILLDGSKPITVEDKEIIEKNKNSNILIAINKTDLPPAWETRTIADLLPPERKILHISAKFGTGLEELKNIIVDSCLSVNYIDVGGAMITNMRHKIALEKSLANVGAAKTNILNGMSPEFAAFDLREALDNLDEITGRKINDEILDKIFSSFCIGK
jgi:tRNA modification GTPase